MMAPPAVLLVPLLLIAFVAGQDIHSRGFSEVENKRLYVAAEEEALEKNRVKEDIFGRPSQVSSSESQSKKAKKHKDESSKKRKSAKTKERKGVSEDGVVRPDIFGEGGTNTEASGQGSSNDGNGSESGNTKGSSSSKSENSGRKTSRTRGKGSSKGGNGSESASGKGGRSESGSIASKRKGSRRNALGIEEEKMIKDRVHADIFGRPAPVTVDSDSKKTKQKKHKDDSSNKAKRIKAKESKRVSEDGVVKPDIFGEDTGNTASNTPGSDSRSSSSSGKGSAKGGESGKSERSSASGKSGISKGASKSKGSGKSSGKSSGTASRSSEQGGVVASAEPKPLAAVEEELSPTPGPTVLEGPYFVGSVIEDASNSATTATDLSASNVPNPSTVEDSTLNVTESGVVSVTVSVDTVEATPVNSELVDGTPSLGCPLNGWPSFKMRSFTGDFIQYPFRKGEVSSEIRTGEVLFSVTKSCAYKIKEKDAEGSPLVYRAPLDWLDMGVLFFSGIAGPRTDVTLSGTSAPTISEVTIAETDRAVEVLIASTSAAVLGSEPLVWLFPSFTDAKEFEYFLTSLHRYAPAIFLTNDSMACGSGPVCKVLGGEVCFYNPIGGVLGAGNATHVGFVRNSMQWFRHCASMIGCERLTEGGSFLYFAAPEYAVVNSTFSFVGRGVVDGSIDFECPSSVEAELLGEFVSDLVSDPFHSLGLGGPSQPGFDHHRRFV